MRVPGVSVLHVVHAQDAAALGILGRTTLVLAGMGVDQALVALHDGRGLGAAAAAAYGADIRPIAVPGRKHFGKVRALREALDALCRERSPYALHLHGMQACLLGARALADGRERGRVLCSPRLERSGSPWRSALLGRMLQSRLQHLECAAVTACLTEAHEVSRLLGRSAEVLPQPVHDAFFQVVRREEGRAPGVLAGGAAEDGVHAATRLSVLLNGRDLRVPIAWLGPADRAARGQLEAAGLPVLAGADAASRARALASAYAFVHVAEAGPLPLAVAEAMAVGVPCLVSDTPANRALVRHGETGYVCTSERDLFEKLILVLRDRPERMRVGFAARADAERRFTHRHFARAILRAYGFSRSAEAEDAFALAPLRPALTIERSP